MKHRNSPGFKAPAVGNAKLIAIQRKGRKRHGHQNMSKGAIRRLARRGGVKRLSALVYDEMRAVHRLFLERIVRAAIVFCEYQKRKTVMAEDVVRAISTRGQWLYGFDEKPFLFSKRTSARLVDDTQSTLTSSLASGFESEDSTPQNIQLQRRLSPRIAGNSASTSRNKINDGASTSRSMINDGASTSRGIINDGASTSRGIINDGASTSRGIINDGASTSRSKINDGASTSRGIINDGASTSRGIINDRTSTLRSRAAKYIETPTRSSARFNKSTKAEAGGVGNIVSGNESTESDLESLDDVRNRYEKSSERGRSFSNSNGSVQAIDSEDDFVPTPKRK